MKSSANLRSVVTSCSGGSQALTRAILLGQPPQPEHRQAFALGGVGFVDRGLQVRMLGDQLVGFARGRHPLAEDEPGDRPVGGVGRVDDRLVGVFGIVGHLGQLGVDLEHRLLHVGADGELERHPAHRVHALGGHLADAFDALELLLLLLNDLALDLLRAGAGPDGFDRQRRDLAPPA